ncbi:MAG: hypothetical protein MI975_20180 [Cytophagales bacterium]|nr:hypothetical protein [Cytophagales bacterium]
MTTAPLSEIKSELSEKSPHELIEYCLRMAKYKRDNKELLNYLLFEAYDEEHFKEKLKLELDSQFAEINLSSVYYAKKSLRRILRFVSKHIKYSGMKQTEVELRIYYCRLFRQLPLPFHTSSVLLNLYDKQLTSIQKALKVMHRDVQFDYLSEMAEIQRPLAGP